jgi:hypothetical protein
MEHPSKEEEPFRYVERRLDEMQKEIIPKEERDIINEIADSFYGIADEVCVDYLDDSHMYVLNVLDKICDLYRERGRANNQEIEIMKKIAVNSKELFKIVKGLGTLLEELVEDGNTLEAKSVSESIIEQMRFNSNQK